MCNQNLIHCGNLEQLMNNSTQIEQLMENSEMGEKILALYSKTGCPFNDSLNGQKANTGFCWLSLTLFLQGWIFKYICHVLSRLDKNITTIILIRGVLLCEYCPYFAWDLFVCSSTGNQSSVNELSFLHEYMQVPVYGRGLIGHQMKDFIKSCSFGGLDCPIDNG